MGVDKFMQIDDDVDFLVRRADDDWRLVAADHESVDQMLLKIEELLIDHGSVGVSSREGNNRAGVGGPGDLVARDTRLMRVYGCRTREFLEMEHGRVVVMDDFEFHVQMLRAGHRNACLFYWANGQRMTGSPGGCTDYRTLQVHHDSAVRFSELHPGFVRLRQKKNKGGGLAERTEVSVYWKRAAEEGARRKAGEIQ